MFVSWAPEDEERIRNRQYEGASADWVRDFYLRPNALAYIEYGVLLTALVTLAAVW